MKNGDEHVLNVYFDNAIIATLSLHEEQLCWEYTSNWRQTGFSVSPHLPLTNEFPATHAQRFIRNLFPEGEGLQALLSSFQLSKSNTFGLVRAMGIDTPGSFWFLAKENKMPTEASFRPVTSEELQNKLDNGSESSLFIWDGKPRLSVAGVQNKINVVVDEGGHIGFGEGVLTSTHILKFETKASSHLVLNEFITMQLAKACGLQVAKTELKRFGRFPALLVERFDRKFISMNKIQRRHMIDGCQALNLAPEYKYERNFGNGRDVAHIRDGASFEKLFQFAYQCENPATTKEKLLDWALFNLLINNFDAHGKNISFFVGMRGMSLTPFYDLVNVKMYPDFDSDLAMGFGEEFNPDAITAYQLADFAQVCDLSRHLLIIRFKRIINNLQMAIKNIKFDACVDAGEKRYLERYKKIVAARCDHFQGQIKDITAVRL